MIRLFFAPMNMALLTYTINKEEPFRHGEIQTNPPKAQRRIIDG